jgi:hypothetical protein
MKDGSYSIEGKEEVMTFSFGNLFPPNMRYLGFGLLMLSVVTATEIVGAAVIVAYIGAWMSFRKSGVQVKPRLKLRREYTGFLFKTGKWKSYDNYPDLAFMRSREGFRAYSRGMVELDDSEQVFDIYLLSQDYRKRLVLMRCTDQKTAEEKGKGMAMSLGLNWTRYKPVLSEKTRLRKR